MEILILRNYYSSLTRSSIGDDNITEDVSRELSPRYSRNIAGNYVLEFFQPTFISSSNTFSFGYGTYNINTLSCIWFGKNTAPVTFNDYSAVGDYNVRLDAVQTSNNTTYNDNTKTYTNVRMFTITNTSSNILPVNEILIGTKTIAYIRELLGENSFTIGANESVKFELTIKYTVAEPLR